VWDKGGLGMGWHYRRSYEFVLVAQKKGGACNWQGGNSESNVVRIPKIIPAANQHPCEKPVALMEHFIRLHSRPGELVLEPYLGRGATLVAAYQSGRAAIGCDIDEHWAEAAAKRLEAELAQGRLFEPSEVAQPMQEAFALEEAAK
jgi:DNA modification methylase